MIEQKSTSWVQTIQLGRMDEWMHERKLNTWIVENYETKWHNNEISMTCNELQLIVKDNQLAGLWLGTGFSR